MVDRIADQNSAWPLFWHREDSDVIKLFAEEALERCDGKAMTPAGVYKLYTTWSAVFGIKTINSIALGKRLRQLGFAKTRSNGKDYWCLDMSDAGKEISKKGLLKVEAVETESKPMRSAVVDVESSAVDAAAADGERLAS